MSVRVRLLVGALIVGAFGYGFLAGSYRLPPFYQVAWVKNALLARRAPPMLDIVPATAMSATVVETGLQRLLVKRVQLPTPDNEYSGGGALTTAGSVLYVLSTNGGLLAVDPSRPKRIGVAVPAVPINRDEMMQSRLRYTINTFWFRVAGAFAEATDDSTHVLYAMHNRYESSESCITFVISRITLRVSADSIRALDAWRPLFTTSPCMTMQRDAGPGRYPYSGHISGGKMIAFDATRLLVTVGDYTYDGWQRPAWAQDRSNPYGKLVLVDKSRGTWEIFARGARNDMGLYRDSTGAVWATESGPQGGDELNLVAQGADLGWPAQTHGINYENTLWPPAARQGRHDGAVPPVFSWLPSVVPTNLVRLSGFAGMFEPWRGDLLIGTLRDQALHHLRLTRDGRVAYDERIPIGDRIRDLVRLPDGRIAMLTDATGRLMIVDDGGPLWVPVDSSTIRRLAALDRFDTVVPTVPAPASAAPATGGAPTSGDSAGAGAAGASVAHAPGSADAIFTAKCSSCHGRDGRIIVGPPLDGLMTRYVGARAGFTYSPALRDDGRFWSPSLLAAFLRNPAGTWPGTRMPKVPLTATEIDSLVALLSRPQ